MPAPSRTPRPLLLAVAAVAAVAVPLLGPAIAREGPSAVRGGSEDLPVATGAALAPLRATDASPADAQVPLSPTSATTDLPTSGPRPGPTLTSPAPAAPPPDPVATTAAAVPPAPAGPAEPAVAPAVPAAGPGTFTRAPGASPAAGAGTRVVRYVVEVEDGLGLDPAAVAADVDAILADPRSWVGFGRWTVQRVDDGTEEARIVVASPATTDALCLPLDTAGRYSCRNGRDVVLNAARWTQGAESWGADVAGYRGYLVNHEFGHYLGFSHTPCPAAGAPAPVMLQQTKGLSGCLANAWPAVTGG